MNAILLTVLWGVLMLTGGLFRGARKISHAFAMIGLLVILALNVLEFFSGPVFDIDVNNMLRVTKFGLLFNVVILISTLWVILLNGKDFEKAGKHVSEYYSLIFFALAGASLVTSFNNLMILFLSFELMALPLYILAGIENENLKGNEASLKLFLMSMFFTAIFLMGVALMYGGNSLGSFHINFFDIRSDKMQPFILAGFILMLAAMAFKVSVAPFHFWAPDVYDGSPTVVTSFMSTVIKIAGFAAFYRLFETTFGVVQSQWQSMVVVLIAASLFIGSTTALFQRSVKRLMAHSAVVHSGFMLFSVFAFGNLAREGLLLYAAAYSLAAIGLYAIISRMDDYTIEGFNGFAQKQPMVAFSASVFLLSLMGIPLTAGFTGKLYLLMAAVTAGHYLWLVIFAVLCIVISAVYYLRIIRAIYFMEPPEEGVSFSDDSPRFKILLGVIVLLIITLGIVPGLLIDWLYY